MEAGTSIRALEECPGHADPGFTLQTYAHLLAQSQDKAKRAINDVIKRLDDEVTTRLVAQRLT